MVRLPIRIAYPASVALGAWVFGLGLRAFTFFPIAFVGCWLHWSYMMPRWRRWAASKGVDPDRLQEVGEQHHLVWRRGSLLEKTEFH